MPARNLGLVDLRRWGKLERTVADSPARRHTMADIARLSVEDARREAVAGRALLVCAYGDERCREVALVYRNGGPTSRNASLTDRRHTAWENRTESEETCHALLSSMPLRSSA
jgi:hypothetical protein